MFRRGRAHRWDVADLGQPLRIGAGRVGAGALMKGINDQEVSMNDAVAEITRATNEWGEAFRSGDISDTVVV